MPTVLRSGSYRFFFYSSDREEPPHIHVERERAQAKFWLGPARLHASVGFSRVELGRIEAMVAGQHDRFLGAWRDYFSD